MNNPEIAESECIVSWAGRGGPDAATAQFGYGTHPEFGAAGHWGFADLGFRGGPPRAGLWHHIAVVFDGVIERVYVNGELNNAEAKMLLMHPGRPILVGASEPGTELFDGYLASLRVYDSALGEAEVKTLAANEPSADVLIHLDSAKLDYGPRKAWENRGSWGGAFSAVGREPAVEDVNGRIAARFDAGSSLEFPITNDRALTDFTLVISAANPTLEPGECVVEFEGTDGGRTTVATGPTSGGWQQVAIVSASGARKSFVNGKPTSRTVPPIPERLRKIRFGGDVPFSGALSRVQLFRRALSDAELAQLHGVRKREWETPAPNPAAFEQSPVSVNASIIAMAAQPGRSPAGGVEYRFARTTSGSTEYSSGWTRNPFFLDVGLQPNMRHTYSVKVRDAIGNVTAPSAPVDAITDHRLFREFSDRFEAGRDFLASGASGSIWDGFLRRADGSAPEAIVVRDSILRLQSSGTVWDGGRPSGAFLFKLVPGDFVAQVRVADYAGLATRRVPGNNDGGLMVRVPNVEDAGGREDLVQLNFFPIWNQGNMVTSLDGGRSQKGNGLAWEAHRHLQIIRQGALFHFRTSADGSHWQDMPGSPVERQDMKGLPLQVGLYHASYGAESSHISFSDFQLTTRSR